MSKSVEQLLEEQNELIRKQNEILAQQNAAAQGASHRAYVEECAQIWDRANPIGKYLWKNPVRR